MTDYRPLPTGITPEALVDLHAVAADWYVRRQSAGWTDADEHALKAWVDASPAHRETFESIGRTRALFGVLAQHRADEGRAAPGRAAAVRPRPTHAWGRWAHLLQGPAFAAALSVLLCVTLLGGWQVWEHTPRERLSLTANDQALRDVRLPDGSVISLNIDSRAEVRYYPRRREVTLLQGEAFFEVAADADRPFTVDSGRSRIRVVGTAFNVRAAPPDLVVKVQQGRVELRPDRDELQGATLALVANTGIAIDPVTGRHRAVPVLAGTVGDWRSGYQRFRRTPLGEVVQELARYLRQPVVLADPALATLPVSGYFAIARPVDFLALLPDQLPLEVAREADGTWVLSPR